MKNLCILLLAALTATAQTYTLHSRDGRTLEIKDPYYDGQELKVTRASDGQNLKFSPDLLTADSWAQLNREATASMRVRLIVKPVAIRKNKETHWQTAYGSSHTTETVSREFEVEVIMANYFEKPITIECYWVTGHTATVEHYRRTVSHTKPIKLIAGGSAEKETLDLKALGITYTSGRETAKTDLVIIVRHENGTISETYASNQSASDLISKLTQSQ